MDESTVYEALHSIVDPGLAESVVDLGLIYRVRLQSSARVTVEMTLPTTHYPHAAEIVKRVHQVTEALPEARQVEVRLIWDPPWTPYRMTASLRAPLGLPEQEPGESLQSPGQAAAGRRGWLGWLLGR